MALQDFHPLQIDVFMGRLTMFDGPMSPLCSRKLRPLNPRMEKSARSPASRLS